MRVTTMWAAAAVLGAIVSAITCGEAAAQPPALDCAKASGEVETLICKDAALAALDRSLADVYRAAQAKAKGRMLSTLRTEQRGWTGGRNECWKSRNGDPTYLTATWQVNSVRACVEGQYKLRIAELQAVWRLLPGTTVSYACQDNPANEVVATLFGSDPASARLERGDRTVTVWQVPAASGAKYEGQNVSFWTKGAEATVSWMKADGQIEELTCRQR